MHLCMSFQVPVYEQSERMRLRILFYFCGKSNKKTKRNILKILFYIFYMIRE